jgi:ATP-binding cassette subfamily B protein
VLSGLVPISYYQEAITIGAIYLVLHYLEMAEGPVYYFSRQIQDLQRVGASLTRIEALQAQRSVIIDGSKTDLPQGALSIHLDRVVFAYEQQPVLDDVSFELAPGRVLGIAGRTGSGKTTLSRLLFRFYDPGSGLIRIGGQDLKGLSRDYLRRRIGLVTQEVQLFDGTVRDNLTFFDQSIRDDVLYEGIQALGLESWYGGLPDGLDTHLGEGAIRLSAGEAQLLAFVRVYTKDPGLLVLDEASSRLDPATERTMSAAIERLAAKRTMILIVHRLETFRRVDDVLILESGRVVEFGQRVELAQDESSAYQGLLAAGGGGLLA